MSTSSYAIMYGPAKAVDLPLEGFLLATPQNRWVWLKNAKGVTVQKGQLGVEKLAEISAAGAGVLEGGQTSDIRLGSFRLQIIKVLKQAEQPSKDQKPEDAFATSTSTLVASSRQQQTHHSTQSQPQPPQLDTELLKVMRPHQEAGAAFLLARLLGEEVRWDDSTGTHSTGAHTHATGRGRGPEAYESSSSSSSSGSSSANTNTLPVTGAVLADDMGMGKTLTALSVLWALVRHGRSKGVVVCPSGLVNNWAAEILKWLPGLASKAIFVKPNKKALQIKEFVQTPADTAPLLVLSYETFRSVAAQLNKATTWEVLVCDEGHRLKNAKQTNTSLALGTCTAVRRLVLTGTPIQNNMDELFSVVDFACPGYLGDLPVFQQHFGRPIMQSQQHCGSSGDGGDDEGGPTQAAHKLQQLLSRVLIRRQRNEVLAAVLPTKSVHLVYCALSEQQRVEYLHHCDACFGAGVEQVGKEVKEAKLRELEKASVLPLMTELRLLSISAFPVPGAGSSEVRTAAISTIENSSN